jgi:hypothetical protein
MSRALMEMWDGVQQRMLCGEAVGAANLQSKVMDNSRIVVVLKEQVIIRDG